MKYIYQNLCASKMWCLWKTRNFILFSRTREEGDEWSAMRSGEDATTVEGDIQGRIKDNKGGGLHWCFGIKDNGIGDGWMETLQQKNFARWCHFIIRGGRAGRPPPLIDGRAVGRAPTSVNA